jgi:hypothetical protein
MMYRKELTIRAMLACACACGLVATRASAAFIDLTPVSPAANSVGSVSLADLQNGVVDGITVGDKIFDGFSYSAIGDMPASANVNVLGFKDMSGNWGISFHGAFVDLPGGSFSDALIRFNVAVSPLLAQQGRRITDAHLAMGGAGVGPGGFISVDESFQPVNNSTLSVEKSAIGPGSSILSDSVIFNTGYISLPVTKDIFASAAANSASPSRVTVIDQSFSQNVPEPATAALSLAMGLALVSAGRKKS